MSPTTSPPTPTPDPPRSDEVWTRFDDALLAACALLPALLAAFGVTSAAPASHDEALVRTVGLGFTGLFRGLDVLVASPLMLVPIGTRALRAGLASALLLGVCGAVAFRCARALAFAVRRTASPRLASAVAAVAVLSAMLAPLWQAEGSAPGGAVTGALLVLLAMALGHRALDDARALRGLALVLGLAASYEPLVLLSALAAAAPWLFTMVGRSRVVTLALPGLTTPGLTGSMLREAAPSFVIGLLPFALPLAILKRTPELALAGADLLSSPFGEQTKARVALGPWAIAEVGVLILLAGAAGAALAAITPAARTWLASVVGVVLVGMLSLALRVPSGPWQASAPLLAATCAVHMLAALALTAAVAAIAGAGVPFAQASAALVVVLELVLPVRAADETATRRDGRADDASTVWNEVAWGAAPAAAVLLVADPQTMRRITAARAVGEMRADLLVVPTFALPSRVTDRALGAEPKLAPLYRDLRLGSPPEELSLATLASQRPLLAGFDPTWDRNLARHFVPVGLGTRFEPEPRGSSDRKKGLDAFEPNRDRLVRVAVARKDPQLASATAKLLRGRAIAIAACGERDVLSRALDDLRPFAPDDPVANTLVRRIVTSKGTIEVHDLRP